MITFKETKWTTIFYPSQNKQNLLVKGENEGGQKSAPPPGPHLLTLRTPVSLPPLLIALVMIGIRPAGHHVQQSALVKCVCK